MSEGRDTDSVPGMSVPSLYMKVTANKLYTWIIKVKSDG